MAGRAESSPDRSSLVARTVQVVLTRPGLAAFIVVGSVMHAAGHALLAAAGGVLARGLAGGAPPIGARAGALLGALGAGDAALGLAIAGLFAAVAKLVGGTLASWAEERVAGEVGEGLRLEVLDALLGARARAHPLRPPRHGDHGSAQVSGSPRARRVASLTTHVQAVEAGVARGVFGEARGLAQLAPLAALLVVFAPRLAGSAAVAMALFGALVLGARRAMKRGHARAASQAEALVGAADEAVRHADVWVTYGAERIIRAHVARLGRDIVATSARLRARAALLSGTSEVLGALALALALALASAGLVGAERGEIVPFAVAFFMAYKPLREIVEARLARGRAEEALGAARDASAGAVVSAPAPAPAPAWRLEELVLDGVVARHGGHAPVSARVAPGRIAAIVGPTGIGKTALLRVLLGLDAAARGAIRYGAASLDGRGPGPAARPFAWAMQEAPILAASLDDNVMLGRSGRAEGDARAILADLGAEPLAASVGDAVLVGERALSGGERQWVAVARALATDLPVLLLDEPTSALDADAQRDMLDAIARLRGRRTVILVTHRPEPLVIADVIVRLEPEDREDRAGADVDLVSA